jgi:hypothetical protein
VISGISLDPDREIEENDSVLSTISILQPWVTNLASGLIGALVGGYISYRGALIGAESAAKTAFEVQQREFEAREKAEKDAALALIRGTVQSI